MHGFGKLSDVSFLKGAELLQVCIGENEIILNFFPYEISITVFNVREFLRDNAFIFEPLVGMQKRIRQIGKTIDRFVVVDNQTAFLAMSDGSEICLRDESDEFESITFKSPKGVVVV